MGSSDPQPASPATLSLPPFTEPIASQSYGTESRQSLFGQTPPTARRRHPASARSYSRMIPVPPSVTNPPAAKRQNGPRLYLNLMPGG